MHCFVVEFRENGFTRECPNWNLILILPKYLGLSPSYVKYELYFIFFISIVVMRKEWGHAYKETAEYLHNYWMSSFSWRWRGWFFPNALKLAPCTSEMVPRVELRRVCVRVSTWKVAGFFTAQAWLNTSSLLHQSLSLTVILNI